jgi:hypothetical protein
MEPDCLKLAAVVFIPDVDVQTELYVVILAVTFSPESVSN